MKLFRRSKPSQLPARQVSPVGRTTAYAYHAQRSTEPSVTGRQLPGSVVSVRSAKRAAKYWRQRFGLLVVIIAVILGVGNMLTLATEPVIKPAGDTAVAFLHPLYTYQRAAEKLLAGSLLNRNKITVDTSSVTTGLERQFPELSVVTVTLPLFGYHPVVYVAQSDPTLLLTATDGETYVVDATGRAIAPGSVAHAALQLIPVRDASGATIQLGQLAVPASTVAFIKAMHFQLAQRQLRIASFVLPAGSSELDIELADQKYIVKCNVASGSVLQQAGTFLAMHQYFEEQGITPSRYVDVRVDGRAYYK